LNDDLDDRYRRASALDPSRPSESVRAAVQRHAADLAAQRAAENLGTRIDPARTARKRRWRRPAVVGTLAAAAVAGMLITPRFMSPREDSRQKSAGQPVADFAARVPAAAQVQPVTVTAARREAHATTPLRQAAEAGDMVALKKLLSPPSDIDARDARGRTALMLATLEGRGAAVDALLGAGADPNAADAAGTTPLQAAMAGGHSDIIAALQRAGAR
jgi:hypothetical protein